MPIRNLLTGNGFEGGAYGSAWFSAWLTIGILIIIVFFIFIVLRNDMMPFEFSLAGSLLGILLAIILISFTTWNKFAFLVGIIGILVGGLLVGRFTGQ